MPDSTVNPEDVVRQKASRRPTWRKGSLEVLCRTISSFNLVFFRCLVRGCGKDAKIDTERRKQQKNKAQINNIVASELIDEINNKIKCNQFNESIISKEIDDLKQFAEKCRVKSLKLDTNKCFYFN